MGDRQILNSNDDNVQDIQDVSRLLSCSIHNRGDVFKKRSSSSCNGTVGNDIFKENGLDRERAFEVAKNQLDKVVQLQNDVDELRLKLSDRWTDHLASNCQIQ